MSIWQFADLARNPELFGSFAGHCPFCNKHLHHLSTTTGDIRGDFHDDSRIAILLCQLCGWWSTRQEREIWLRYDDWDQIDTLCLEEASIAAASLKNLDVADISTPLDDVRTYLLARYEKRFSLHPRLFEETVASVFRDSGYEAVVTAYSGDGGIDVVLSDGVATVGVQVKRYQSKISVEQIRSFTGALVLAGQTRGIFVTTSSFQRGVAGAAEALRAKGYSVDLIDAMHFYDALELNQQRQFSSAEEFLDFYDVTTMGDAIETANYLSAG